MTDKTRYHIQGTYIIDTESKPSRRIYIREILDIGSAEFSRSPMTAQQRLEIITELGMDSLTQVLAQCYKNKGGGPDYDAERDARLALLLLQHKIAALATPPH